MVATGWCWRSILHILHSDCEEQSLSKSNTIILTEAGKVKVAPKIFCCLCENGCFSDFVGISLMLVALRLKSEECKHSNDRECLFCFLPPCPVHQAVFVTFSCDGNRSLLHCYEFVLNASFGLKNCMPLWRLCHKSGAPGDATGELRYECA